MAPPRLLPTEPVEVQPHVPLHSVLLDCEVKGALATIKATQRFVNTTQQPQECTLRLPVDENSAIAKLDITLDDGRVLTAKVKDLDAAKEAYSDAISSGHTAVFGEMKDEKNFDLNVGNLAPNSGLETTLHFVVPLTCNGNKWLFSVPQWLMPEWGKPPMPAHVFKALAKDERRNEFGFSLRVVQTAEITRVQSVGPRDIEFTLDLFKHEAEVSLTSSSIRGAIRIEFETNEDLDPRTQLELDETTGEYVGMLSFIPPLLSAGESINDLEGTGDYVLLLDRSGSMSGRAIEMAKEATILFIKSLSEGNKFNIVSFGTGFEKMFRESQIVNSVHVEEAIDRIRSFKADMGGTNIHSPLQAVYSEASNPAYPRSLYLLTDGGVENKESVVSIIEANSKQTRVHAFGIGNSVDRSLILEVSKAARGSAEFISDPSEIKKTVMSILKKAILPSLSNLQVTWPSQTYEQFPSNKLLPVCYFGELLVAFVYYGQEPPAPGSVMLQCVNTGSKSASTWTVAIDTNSSLGSGLHKLWAKHAIRELSIEYKKSHSEATLTRVKAISKKYGVPSEYTAFLCVAENDKPVTGKMQSTTISMQSSAQPLFGAGYAGGSLFGSPPPASPQYAPPGGPFLGAQNPGNFMSFGFTPPPAMAMRAPGALPMMRGGTFGAPPAPSLPIVQSRNPVIARSAATVPPPKSGMAMRAATDPFQDLFQPPQASAPARPAAPTEPAFSAKPANPFQHSLFDAMPANSSPAIPPPPMMSMQRNVQQDDFQNRCPQQYAMAQASFAPSEGMGGSAFPQAPSAPSFQAMSGFGDLLDMPAEVFSAKAPPPAARREYDFIERDIQREAKRAPPHLLTSLLSASLMDLISRQETSGKWLAAKIAVDCPVPADFQYPDAGDVWATLCVVVLIEAKFAAQAEEWELIIRKARKVLKSAGVNIEQYRDQVKAQLRL